MGEESTKRELRTTLPVGLDILSFSFRGQTDVESRWVWKPWDYLLPTRDTYFGKSFEFSFTLFDSFGNWTISEGQLTVALTPVEMNRWRGGEEESSTIPLGANPKALSVAKLKGIFYESLTVSADDFKWGELTRYTRSGEQKWEGMLCHYRKLNERVFDRSREPYREVYLHVWFQPPDEQLLYSRYGRLRWE